MKAVMQFALRGYKRWMSPVLPNACRFVPTCSEYAIEAVERHGALGGSWLAARRLLRCHPFSRAGYDPVPPKISGSQHSYTFGVTSQSSAGAALASTAYGCRHPNSRPLADGAEK